LVKIKRKSCADAPVTRHVMVAPHSLCPRHLSPTLARTLHCPRSRTAKPRAALQYAAV
jgi:hypothetical protein